MGKRWKFKQIKDFLANNPHNNKGYWTIKEEYADDDIIYRYKTSLTIYCSRHNSYHTILAHQIINQTWHCFSCFMAQKLPSIEELKQQFDNKGYILLSEDYLHAKDSLEYICKKHPQEIQKISWDSFSHGHGCRFCAFEKTGKRSRLPIEVIKKQVEERGYEFIKVEYQSKPYPATYIYYKCPKHPKQILKINRSNFIQGCGCPYCDESHGEREIAKTLDKFSIFYEREKSFPDCIYKKVLKFDFYLPDYNLCIEFQGEQHYDIEFFMRTVKGEERQLKLFQDLINRDITKKIYCKTHGIDLLEIKYDEIKQTEEIIINKLKLNK